MITYDQVQPHNCAQLTTLMQTCFPANSHICKQAIEWAFFHPRFENRLVSWVAQDGNEILSHYGNQWHPIQRGGNQFTTYLCLDMATLPKARGQGLISQLSKRTYQRIHEAHADFTIGFSNQYGIEVDRNSANYGYKIIGQFQDYASVPLWDKQVHFEKTFLNEVPRIIPGDYYSIDKSSSYIQWRYQDKPYHPYVIIPFTYKLHHGTLVVKQSSRFLDVLDLFLPEYNIETVQAAFLAARSWAFQHHRLGVTCKFFPNTLLCHAIKRAGYVAVPQRLQTHPYWLTIKIHNSTDSDILKPDLWWLMGGDIL